MSDYIKREDAQKITAEWLSGYINDDERNVIEHIDIDLGELPPADVRENVRGEWRDIQIGNWHGVECTVCKIAHDGRDVPRKNGGIVAWNFCPNCGADMRGDNP